MGYDIHALIANLDTGPNVVPRVPSMNNRFIKPRQGCDSGDEPHTELKAMSFPALDHPFAVASYACSPPPPQS